MSTLSMLRSPDSQRLTAALDTPSARASSACVRRILLRIRLNSSGFISRLVANGNTVSGAVKVFLTLFSEDGMIGYHAVPFGRPARYAGSVRCGLTVGP